MRARILAQKSEEATASSASLLAMPLKSRVQMPCENSLYMEVYYEVVNRLHSQALLGKSIKTDFKGQN